MHCRLGWVARGMNVALVGYGSPGPLSRPNVGRGVSQAGGGQSVGQGRQVGGACMFCREARMRSPDFRATISLSSRDCGACTLFRAAAAWMLAVGAARSDQDPAM